MLTDYYEIGIRSDFGEFTFKSTGINGTIEKVVRYSHTGHFNLYNLAFGDLNPDTGRLDDLTVSDNGDIRKVLTTVAATIYLFTQQNPDAYVVISGSTPSRTRLYRMVIGNRLPEILEEFFVWGYLKAAWSEFKKEIDYEAFLVRRRPKLKLYGHETKKGQAAQGRYKDQ